MRALLGLTGYLNGMKKTGMLDCVMYIAGNADIYFILLYLNIYIIFIYFVYTDI